MLLGALGNPVQRVFCAIKSCCEAMQTKVLRKPGHLFLCKVSLAATETLKLLCQPIVAVLYLDYQQSS